MKPICYNDKSGNLYFVYSRKQIKAYLKMVCDYLQDKKKGKNIRSINDLLKARKKIQDKLDYILKDERSEDIYLLSADLYYMMKEKQYRTILEMYDFILDIYTSFYRVALEPSESAMVDSPIASETYVDFRNIEDSNQDIMVAKAQSFFSAFDKPKMLSEVLTQTDLNKFVTLYHNDPRFINEVATYLYNRRNNKNIGVSDYLRLEQRICATKQKNRI